MRNLRRVISMPTQTYRTNRITRKMVLSTAVVNEWAELTQLPHYQYGSVDQGKLGAIRHSLAYIAELKTRQQNAIKQSNDKYSQWVDSNRTDDQAYKSMHGWQDINCELSTAIESAEYVLSLFRGY